MSNKCRYIQQELHVDSTELSISAIERNGDKPTILFLHGFGSTKEDYADIQRYQSFDQYGMLAYDAPGCGMSLCEDATRIDIPLLVKTALALLDIKGIEKFHLVGHSMGGLTALMLASQYPKRVLSFCNIEGNIAPEDCFLSRQIHDYPAENPQAFMDDFIDRARKAPAWSSPLFASSLQYKVRPDAVRGIFTSMVDLSDNGNLMERFLNLPCPKMFMYGDQNTTLSYLSNITAKGVELAEIPQCGHFPMYSNPPEMWRRLGEFIQR